MHACRSTLEDPTIPAYNAAATIEESIRSVLAQTVPPAEIIVVDDGSTDETAALVRAIGGPVKLVSQDNQGPGAATTNGIRAATAPLLAGLDGDDLWLPAKIEKQLAVLAADPGAGGVFCRLASFVGTPDRANYADAREGWTRTTMLLPTAAALANGPVIDPPGRGLGDMIDWFARLREGGNRLVMMPEVLALRRIRPGSLTFDPTAEASRGYMHVVREALKRRRQRETDGEK